LNPPPTQRRAFDEVKLAGDKLKQTLKDFGVEVEVAEVKEGPAVTRFEKIGSRDKGKKDNKPFQ